MEEQESARDRIQREREDERAMGMHIHQSIQDQRDKEIEREEWQQMHGW